MDCYREHLQKVRLKKKMHNCRRNSVFFWKIISAPIVPQTNLENY